MENQQFTILSFVSLGLRVGWPGIFFVGEKQGWEMVKHGPENENIAKMGWKVGNMRH